jgi:hypothetical protein
MLLLLKFGTILQDLRSVVSVDLGQTLEKTPNL